MKDIVVIGAGGLGREVSALIEDINRNEATWNFWGFIDETPEKQGAFINNHKVLGGFEWLENHPEENLWSVCAIGNPRDRYQLIRKARKFKLRFANLIHPTAVLNEFIRMGEGNIVCAHSLISVNTKIGHHTLISPGCGIGHDVTLGDYATLYWNVTLSGYVTGHEGCEIGSGAVVIPKVSVGDWSILGAGAVAIKDIPDHCTAVGIPAEVIKTHASGFSLQ